MFLLKQIFVRKFCADTGNVSMKTCQNLMSSNYFHKNGVLVSHVAASFASF
jgi:hypothetical protein